MASFLEQMFRTGPGPAALSDETFRRTLQEAILTDNAAAFRNALFQRDAELANEHHLYGVLIKSSNGIEPLIVDENGTKLSAKAVVAPGVPLHFLNVEFTATQMKAKIGDELWAVPLDRIVSKERADDSPGSIIGS